METSLRESTTIKCISCKWKKFYILVNLEHHSGFWLVGWLVFSVQCQMRVWKYIPTAAAWRNGWYVAGTQKPEVEVATS